MAGHFLEKYNNQEGTNVTGYSKETLKLLTAYSWPGNIRGLENVIWNAVFIRRCGKIRPEDIDLADVSRTEDKIEIDVPAGRIDFHEFIEAAAKQLVSVTLLRFNGDTTLARESLGLKRWDNVTKKYGINLKELAQPLQQTDTKEKRQSDYPSRNLPELNVRQMAAIQYLKANPSLNTDRYSELPAKSLGHSGEHSEGVITVIGIF